MSANTFINYSDCIEAAMRSFYCVYSTSENGGTKYFTILSKLNDITGFYPQVAVKGNGIIKIYGCLANNISRSVKDRVLRKINDANFKAEWTKFSIDDDNDVYAEVDYELESSVLSGIDFLKILVKYGDEVEESYTDIMRSIYG